MTGTEAFIRTIELIKSSYPEISNLSKVDGLFTKVLYDRIKEKLFLINDRNGLAHLYYGVFKKQLVWGSELNFFINRELKTTINKDKIMDFLNLGYAIGDDTWFDEVNLLPPASYLEWDLKQFELINKNSYWSHKKLKIISFSDPEKEIISNLKHLFQEAVAKRIGNQERVGITLSGGLDSRLIFANIPFQEQRFTAITRDMENAGDIELAKQVVALRKDCQHIVKTINAANWIKGRIEAVMVTSGQKNIMDMNSMSSLPIHKNYFDINLDGAGGDGIFTGGHLKYEGVSDLHRAFTKTYCRNSLEEESKSLDKLVKCFKIIDSDQHFYIYERIRRFIVFGSLLGHEYEVITRFPF